MFEMTPLFLVLLFLPWHVFGEDDSPCNWEVYLSRYPELASKGVVTFAQAKQHYESVGIEQGWQCTTEFQPVGLELFRGRKSNCSKAIDFSFVDSIRKKLSEAHNGTGQEQIMTMGAVVPPKVQSVLGRLKLVNVGAGTTGTKYVAITFYQNLHLRGFHWKNKKIIHPGPNLLMHWWMTIALCVSETDTKRSDKCKSQSLLQSLHESFAELFNGTDFFTDSPIDVTYAAYAQYLEHAVITMTLRDPIKWATRRISIHPEYCIVCNAKVYALGQARHPMDILVCLNSTEYAYQALVNEHNVQALARAFTEMNSYNAAISKKLHIICLWDDVSEKKNSLQEMYAVWKHFAREEKTIT